MMVMSSVTLRSQTVVSLFLVSLPVVMRAVGWPKRTSSYSFLNEIEKGRDGYNRLIDERDRKRGRGVGRKRRREKRRIEKRVFFGPLFLLQTLMVSALPVTMWLPWGFHRRQRIRSSCLSSSLRWKPKGCRFPFRRKTAAAATLHCSSTSAQTFPSDRQ